MSGIKYADEYPTGHLETIFSQTNREPSEFIDEQTHVNITRGCLKPLFIRLMRTLLREKAFGYHSAGVPY
jgi:hypothetical protein